MADSSPHIYPNKLTRAGHFLAENLHERNQPIMTEYELYLQVAKMYHNKDKQRLYLRSGHVTFDAYRRHRKTLQSANVIDWDRDYKTAIRIFSVPDLPAEDISCTVDTLCYVSHLSAMQRWGLTNRTPKDLFLTKPARQEAKAILMENLKSSGLDEEEASDAPPLRNISHPRRVRKRPIRMLETKSYGSSILLKGSRVRISTIGQTFLDMLQKPALCGGMSHILDIWIREAPTHFDQIVDAIHKSNSNIVKSRAGYILDEKLGLRHSKIQEWKTQTQRGGSRKLDPEKPFKPTFSEDWEISLNVE